MKNKLFTLGVMALLFAACSVKEMDIAPPVAKDADEFFATIEDGSTRVFVDDDLMVLWHADDRVSIFNKYTYNQQYRFTGYTGANSGSFTKVPNDDFVTGNALNSVYAIYPYKESTEISNQGVLTIDLPATQSYAENSFGVGANTMVSCSEGNELLFKNLCGYIMLKLYGDNVTVKSISIKGNNDESLAGKATVNASIDNAPTMTFDASATKEITLTFDTPVTLGTTAETATTFWLVVPPTTFSKGITVTVKDDKNGEFTKSTTASLLVSRNTLKRLSALKTIMSTSISVPEAIDLGLPSGLKWASFNLGATKPEEYGDYYAWGETEPKSDYSWSYYEWGTSSITLTKYVMTSDYGNVDELSLLEASDDVVQRKLGMGWHLPTIDDWKELYDSRYTTWTWDSNNKGYIVRSIVPGQESNSIFLPAGGYFDNSSLQMAGSFGRYWSSTLYYNSEGNFNSSMGFGIGFNYGGGGPFGSSRQMGFSIRPVSK